MSYRHPYETDAEFQQRFDACWRQSLRKVYKITAAEWTVLAAIARQRWSHFYSDDVDGTEPAIRFHAITGRRLEVSSQLTVHAIAAQLEGYLADALRVDHDEWFVDSILGGSDFYGSLLRLNQLGLVYIFRVDQTRWSGRAVLVAVGGPGAEVEAAYRTDCYRPVLERLPVDPNDELFGDGGDWQQ